MPPCTCLNMGASVTHATSKMMQIPLYLIFTQKGIKPTIRMDDMKH